MNATRYSLLDRYSVVVDDLRRKQYYIINNKTVIQNNM